VALILTALALMPGLAHARVVRLVVEQREAFAGGASWGEAGVYERLTGTAYMEVDPRDPLNRIIVDLDLAPKNARGLVEFSTQFFILRPVDPSRGNRKIYFTVNNRGNDALYTAHTVSDVGANDLYLRLGYTIVDAGWQGDLAPSATRLSPSLPTARQPDGAAIVGPMRVEYSDRNMPLSGAFTLPLEGSAAFRSYEAASTDTARATLTARDTPVGLARRVPADRWAFGRCPTGKASMTPSTFDICLFDGFRADRLYELVYPATHPIVMGLGFAAIRDVGSFLRYERRDRTDSENPLAASAPLANATDSRPTSAQIPETPARGVASEPNAVMRRAYATGASQTGAFLRDFIYLGFNEDEEHRKVFDGVLPTIAGTDRVFINVRFADPNVFGGQDDRRGFLQSAYPPTTYGVTTDPISGLRDGILKRPATDPLIFHTDSATEFYQLWASLNVADGMGNPVMVPENVRLYYNTSTGHGMTLTGLRTGAPGTRPLCAYPTPGGNTADTARALLVAMDAWADAGEEPPKSNYPRLEDGTLVPLDAARSAFPRIPGISAAGVVNELRLLDFGPGFSSTGGVLSKLPPTLGRAYKMFVPKPDADGHDVAGVRPLQIRVPVGTNTGWNVRAREHREPNLCGLTGAFFPFAETRAARLARGDPRPSLEERYKNHEGFVSAVASAVEALVHERMLLSEDAAALLDAARASDILTKSRTSASGR
jgi:hypothetical protein